MDNTSGKGFLPLFCSCLQEIPDKLPQVDVSSLCPPVAYDARALCLAFSSECSWIPREQWAKVLDDGYIRQFQRIYGYGRGNIGTAHTHTNHCN